MDRSKLRNHQFLLSYTLLVLASIAVYFPILKNALLKYWDDQWVVMNGYTSGGMTASNLKDIMLDYYEGQYAPFNEYLYLTLYSINGYDPFIFHLASLTIHLVNSILVMVVIKNLMESTLKFDPDFIRWVSFIAAFIFCVHPVNVESVAWMSASKILVYGLFYLLATITFLKYLKTKKRAYYILTLVLFACSFLGKEQAVTFPVWLLLIYWILNYDLRSKSVWMSVLPFFALSIYFGIITIYSQYPGGDGFLSAQTNYPLWQRIIFGCYAFLEYGFKTLLPFHLSYLYPFPVQVGEKLPTWLMIYPILIIVLFISFRKSLVSLKPLTAGLAFFAIHIAIALHVIPLSRFVIIADRYAYLAIIGLAGILAYYLVLTLRSINSTFYRALLLSVTVLFVSYLGVYAHKRTYVWQTTDTLKKEIRGLLKQRNDYMKPKAKIPSK
ncbi:hypothetical protein FFJ24_005700 [Pedobacter sp. KBS0701]|uniref:hypothetical protein n=1 Tax=Pedobacter sp. KBS0701 TaxID=2578106 RepID=UPI00110F12FC|nr:hypothetical protein [Pedobacter sp. KBS0701]QDW24345.1 hypothetical protein FFJ24_005700 [Pedobacter sp. KBS0701]